MIGLRPFCAPEFIQLYKNLIFCYSQILLTLSHLSKNPYGIKGANSLCPALYYQSRDPNIFINMHLKTSVTNEKP